MEESNTKSSSSTSSSSRASHTQFSQWILCAQNNIHAPVTGQQQLHRLFRTFIVDELKLNKIKQKTRNIRWNTSSTKRHVQTNAMRINFIWVMYYGIRADRFTVQFFPPFFLSLSLFLPSRSTSFLISQTSAVWLTCSAPNAQAHPHSKEWAELQCCIRSF